MKQHVRQKKFILCSTAILLNLFLLYNLTSCVSVKLGNEDVKKSSAAQFQKPGVPFQSLDLKNADYAWQNKATGTTLSYLSICNDTNDPSLESLRNSTLRGLDSIKIENEEQITYNKREGLKSEVTGQLDGVKVAVRLLIFKKNFCSYTISMVEIQGKGASDKQQYDKFIEGFVVQ